MNFHADESVALFIDGANLNATARALGFGIDYARLPDVFAAGARVVRAYFYTAVLEIDDHAPLRPLVDWLDYNGYTVVTKPAKTFTDALGNRRVKGDMDVEMAIDMIEMAGKIDHAVLFSGDGDFRRLVAAIQREGVRVSVVSTLRTSPPMAADALRRQADVFVDLQDLEPRIARAPRPTDARAPTPSRPGLGAVDAG